MVRKLIPSTEGWPMERQATIQSLQGCMVLALQDSNAHQAVNCHGNEAV